MGKRSPSLRLGGWEDLVTQKVPAGSRSRSMRIPHDRKHTNLKGVIQITTGKREAD